MTDINYKSNGRFNTHQNHENDLTPTEQAQLDQLLKSQQRADDRVELPNDAITQEYMTGLFLTDADAVSIFRDTLDPNCFTAEHHRELVRFVFEYHRNYGATPRRDFVMDRMRAWTAQKDAKHQLAALAGANLIYERYCPNLYDRGHLIDQIHRFNHEAQARTLLKEWLSSDHLVSDTKTLTEKLARLESQTGSKEWATLRRFHEVEEIAKTQIEDWLLPNWLEFGALTILTGLPFSGKSCIVADIIAAIATNSLWCDLPIQQCPILLIQLENKESVIARRIHAALGENRGRIDDLYFDLDIGSITLPLSVDDIGKMIGKVQAALGEVGQKCLVVIDTMRSAFQSNELDQQEMAKLLYPLGAVARASNAAILLLHHNSRGKNEYAGSAAIAAAADCMWDWNSDYATGEGTLRQTGTRGATVPDGLSFEYRQGKNHYIGSLKANALWKHTRQAQHEARELVALVGEDGTLDRHTVESKLGLGRTAVQDRLDAAVDFGYLTRTGGGGIKYIYTLTESGRVLDKLGA